MPGTEVDEGGHEVASQYNSSFAPFDDEYTGPNQYAGSATNNGYFSNIMDPQNNGTFLSEIMEQTEHSNGGGHDQSSQPASNSNGKGSQRTLNFNEDEDMLLCKAWLNVGIDPIHGTDQSSMTYWNRILEYYNTHKKIASSRNANSLMNRWSVILKSVNHFVGSYTQIELAHKSGVTIQDSMVEAKALYKKTHPKKETFKLLHCWNVLHKHQKWIDKVEELKKKDTQKKKRKSVNQTSTAPELHTNDKSTIEDGNNGGSPDSTPARRPIGNKKAKQALKASGSQNRLLASFDNMWEKKKEADQEKEAKKEAKKDERFKLLYDLEREEFEHKRMLDDERIMTMDLSGMSAQQQAFYMSVTEDIMNRRGGHA